MKYQRFRTTIAFMALVVMSMLSHTAQAAKLADVFNGEMLGTSQRYFESVAGIARSNLMDVHTFVVDGCTVEATIRGGAITALRLDLEKKCQADLSSFLGSYAPKSRGLPFGLFQKALTVGDFVKGVGDVSYLADCVSQCGNAYDPSVYAYWMGPRATQFLDVLLEVKLVSDAAIDAAHTWKNVMIREAGEDYVIDTRFNCDNRFSSEAAKAFENVEATAITIGRELVIPTCPSTPIATPAFEECAYPLDPDEANPLWEEMRDNPQSNFEQCVLAMTQIAIEFGGETPADARQHAINTCQERIQKAYACMAIPGAQANQCICGMDP